MPSFPKTKKPECPADLNWMDWFLRQIKWGQVLLMILYSDSVELINCNWYEEKLYFDFWKLFFFYFFFKMWIQHIWLVHDFYQNAASNWFISNPHTRQCIFNLFSSGRRVCVVWKSRHSLLKSRQKPATHTNNMKRKTDEWWERWLFAISANLRNGWSQLIAVNSYEILDLTYCSAQFYVEMSPLHQEPVHQRDPSPICLRLIKLQQHQQQGHPTYFLDR